MTESDSMPDFLPAQRAIELLGIKPQTLYAYVARGWIRAIAQSGTHQKLYSRVDVERVRSRSVARSGHGPVAAGALRWGEPVISTAITEITPEGPRYRSRLATDLIRLGSTYETVADLLWTGVWSGRKAGWEVQAPSKIFYDIASDTISRLPAMRFRELLATLVQLLSVVCDGDRRVYGADVVSDARQMICVLAGAFAFLSNESLIVPRPGESVARVLTRALHLGRQYESLLDAIMILCADHELSTPTFVARVTASAGANLSTCIQAGIAAFQGPLTGDDLDWVGELLDSAPNKAILLEGFAQTYKRGRQVAGFNHPLYPLGDPRARFLIETITQMPDAAPEALVLIEFIVECERRWRMRPSLPVALVAAQLAFGMPPHTGGALFLLARIAGYVAHVLEQRGEGFLMRPRAKFSP